MGETILSEVEDFGKLKEELKSIILNDGIVWGSSTDQNGKPYNWVFDTKAFLLNPRGLYPTTKLFMDKIRKYTPDAVGGLTLASHLIASSLSYLSYGHKEFDAFLVRRSQKEHGMLKLVEGPDISNKKVVIIDDGLNAAGFAMQAIKAVEKSGCKVLAVVVLINFENNDFIELRNQGYAVESIFTLKELGLDTRHIPDKPDLFKLKWKYGKVNTSDYTAPKSSPVVNNGKVYVGSDQGKMLCLDFNGNLLWEFKTDEHPHGVHQTPIIAGNKVIFSAYDGGVYAINKENGILIWKNKASSYSGASPVYDSETGMVYIGLENSTLKGTMAALDIKNGDVIWEFLTNNHVPSRPAIGKNILIFGSNDCFIYALDKWNGNLLWKFKAEGEVKGRLTIDENLCYATSFDGFLYCLSLSAGELVWKKKLGGKLFSEPLIVGNKVIVGSYSYQLTALDKKNGEILWFFMAGGPIQSYPALHEDLIFFGSHDHNVYAVDSGTGNLVWNFATSNAVTSSPLCCDNSLFVSGNDGYLYCFERQNTSNGMRLQLKSVKKSYTNDSHHSIHPSKTVEIAKEKLSLIGDYGCQELKEIGHLDSMGLPVYRLSCLQRLNESGKGASKMQSMASALMERAERYSALAKFQKFEKIISSFDKLEEPAIPRSSFGVMNIQRIFYGENLDKLEMDWVYAYSFRKNEKVLVPAQCIFLRYATKFPDLYDTSGFASGNTIEEAILHALCEVIERHLLHVAIFNKPKARQIDLDTLRNPYVKKVVNNLRGKGFEIFANDISLGWKINSISTFIYHPLEKRLFSYYFQVGTSTDPEIALLRAITENAQCRAISSMRKSYKVLEKSFLEEASADIIGMLEWSKSHPEVSIDDIKPMSKDDFKEEVGLLIEDILSKGYDALFYDLTNESLKIPVARVLIPGLQPNFVMRGLHYLHKHSTITPHLNVYQDAVEKMKERRLINQKLDEVFQYA